MNFTSEARPQQEGMPLTRTRQELSSSTGRTLAGRVFGRRGEAMNYSRRLRRSLIMTDSRSCLRRTRSQTQRHSISSFPSLENRKRASNEDEMGLGKKRFNTGVGGKGAQAPSVGFSHFKHSPPASTPLLSLSTSLGPTSLSIRRFSQYPKQEQ